MVRDLLKVFNYAIDYAKYNNIDILNFSTYAIFNLSNRDDFNNYAVLTELMCVCQVKIDANGPQKC